MLLTPISQLIVLAALTPAAMTPQDGLSAGAAEMAIPGVISTRQTLFAIPFRIDRRVGEPSQEPVNVQLYVSGNHGTSWQLYARGKPSQERFWFRAGMDGEFWFLVRTLDRSGRSRPEGPSVPGLKVTVDTKPPQLQLDVQRGQAGQVTARWKVDEPNLESDSLSIQYRVDGGPWQAVAVDAAAMAASGAVQTGEVTWWPQQGKGPIEVRAEVRDAAGNPAVSSAKIEPSTTTPNPTGALAATTRQWPTETRPTETDVPNSTKWPAENTSSTPLAGGSLGDRYAAQHATNHMTGQDTLARDTIAGSDSRPVDRLQENRYEAADNIANRNPATGNPATGHPATGNPADRYASQYPAGYAPRKADTVPVESTYPPYSREDPAASPWRPSASNDSVAAAVSPPLYNRYVRPARPTTGQDIFRTPQGERPRMINSKVLELEYDVKLVGPSGITRVELWGTRDGGQTWQSFAVDDDNESPLRTMVREDGLYGFRVVVRNGAGHGAAPPQSGELPDIWVGVDTTKPTARIISAEQDGGLGADKLAVTWEASDGLLADRPISLSFAETPTGPWTTIVAGLENSGRYVWQLDARVPHQIHLRMEVRDEAGNLEQVDMPGPVLLRRPQPSVRIRGVRPLGTTAQARPSYLQAQ